ncbi:MAG: chromosome segregation protein SMC [Candidatus Woesearchaeota archaeon]
MATKILKLAMKGFKSFAHQTEMVFGDDFNVILGPNGSGKSNVIDALCFVLGKSSAKGLRAEKSANLIYNGGKSKTPAKEGEVRIYFDNSDGDFPFDAKEVCLSRTIKNSGQSVYQINGKKYTRTEVLEVLSHARINPDGYNIILQGDIVRFVEMSGDERRKIIEEIADISIYEEKKHKAMLELDKVEQSLKEAHIIMKERKNYLNDLSKEREQAKKYEQYEQAIHQGKATLIHRQLTQKQEKVDGYDSSIQEHAKKQETILTKISQLKKTTKEKHEQVQDINQTIESQGDKEQVEIHKQVEQLKVDIATQNQKIQGIEEEVTRVHSRKGGLEGSKKELDQKIATAKTQLSAYIDQKQQLEKTQKELEQKVIEFKKKNKLDGSQQFEEQLEKIDSDIDQIQKVVDSHRESYQDLLRNKDRLEMQIKNADDQIAKISSIKKEHKKELDALEQKRKEFKTVTVDLSKALSSDSSMASQLATAKSRLHSVQEEVARLQARQAVLQESALGSQAVAKILANKSLKGVHGTVATLGSADKQYSLALEVAAGAKLRALVVETDKVAQECIDYLKKNQLGVATFLPMNKIRVPIQSDVAKTAAKKNGSLGFAKDVITYKSKFRSVFEHVFGNTVIVDKLATARAIGIGTTRMVTLEGDVAETSGVMQGGSRKRQTGGGAFVQQDIVEKLEKFQKDQADLEAVVSKLQQQRQDNEQTITRLRELKANLEGDIIKTEKSLHIEVGELDMSAKVKKEFEQELETVNKDYIQLQNTISTKNRELAQLKIEKQKLRTQISDVRNPAKLAELHTFEDKIREIKDALIRQESEEQSLQKQIANMYEPEIENITKIIKQHEKEAKDFQDKAKVIQDQVKEQNKKLKELEKQEKEFYEKFKKAFDLRTKLLREIDLLEQDIIKQEELLRDQERQSSVISVEVAKLKAEISYLQEEFDQFKNVELLKEEDVEAIKKLIYTNEQRLQDIGPVNMKAVAMYEKVLEEYERLAKKQEVLTQEKEQVLVMINEIESRKKDLFLKVFGRIDENFKRIFSTISTKGEAYLELENKDDPFAGGINVKVKLSGSKFMDIRSLSGGEKTMTALAFIFAIQENDPSSFYIMDEVDAALDKRNAEKLAELINQYCDHAQYVVISHNDGVIGAAKHLYGVSMDQQAGVSKVVSLKL